MKNAQRAGGSQPLNSLTIKLFYGSGQAVDAVLQAIVNTFLLFYLTAVCGMSGSAAGAVFLLSLVVDGLLDPLIGRMSDRSQLRWGRRLPFMAVALPPMALAAILLFTLPTGMSGSGLFAYVLMLNVILRVGLSLFALPHSALTAELTEDYADRSVLSGFRAIFIVIGTAIALLPAFSLIFSGPTGLQDREAYVWLGSWTAVAILFFGVACIFGTARRVLGLPIPAREASSNNTSLFADLAQLFANRSFVMLFVGAVLVLVGQGAASALSLHAYRFFWQLPARFIQLPLLMVPIGMLVGTLLAGISLKHVEKRSGVLCAVAVAAAYPATAIGLVLAGLVEPGSTVGIVIAVMNGAVLGGCGAMCFVCFYSMIADAVDEHDDLFGVRREALYAAALMIGAKAATGLGGFLAGAGLQAVGFDPSTDTSGNLGAIKWVGLLWGPGASMIVIASLPFLLRYRVDRAHHADVLHRLSARRLETVGRVPAQGGDKSGVSAIGTAV